MSWFILFKLLIIFSSLSQLMFTMYHETPWVSRHQALLNANVYTYDHTVGTFRALTCQKLISGGKWSSLMLIPDTFSTLILTSTLMSHICKMWDKKFPSPSTSTWQLLGDSNSWWKVESGMKRSGKEWQAERVTWEDKKQLAATDREGDGWGGGVQLVMVISFLGPCMSFIGHVTLLGNEGQNKEENVNHREWKC